MQLVITNSMRNCFLECQFKFFCEYVLRFTPKREADYFKWGRLVHTCEECLTHNKPVEVAIALEREAAETTITDPRELQAFDEMLELAPKVVDAHFLQWHEDNENYESLGVESEFALPLPCGFIFKGKRDDVVRDVRTGEVLNWERKTAAQVDEWFWEDLLLDSQPKGYLLATQRDLGFDARKVVYDIFGKPQIKHKKWQTRVQFQQELAEVYLLDRKRYFQRRTITFTQEEIDAYWWDLDQVAQMIRWHLEEGIWVKHHPRNRTGGCDYKPYCLRGDESKYYVRDKNMLNPELSRSFA